MLHSYPAIDLSPVSAPARFCSPEQAFPPRVSIDDPAIEVMTDLSQVSAVIIRPTDTIDEALTRMKQRGVRLLLVIDADRMVVGTITTNDVLGEKPMRLVESTGSKHEDILVRDVMTPWRQMQTIPLESVESAKVGHVVATLQHIGRQHALVVDHDGNIRGIFSATQIARLLGVEGQLVNPTEIARTFAEIEALLAR